MSIRRTLQLAICFFPHVVQAEWCEPPLAPTPTSAELAKEFREEFKDEFERYFASATAYTACLDAERARILEEMQITANRYDRFLADEIHWK